jgi:hypothetical protein
MNARIARFVALSALLTGDSYHLLCRSVVIVGSGRPACQA